MSRRGRWLVSVVVLVVLVAALAWGILLPQWSSRARLAVPASPSTVVEDPRLTWESPFQNIHPQVSYVGDAACAECHHEISKKYSQHPMARAMTPIDVEGAGVGSQFDRNGYRYRIEQRQGRVFHYEERLSQDGQVVARVEGEVKYALGSGTRGRAFLIEKDGRVFTSPISWYRLTSSWDLAPEHPEHLHFSRPIVPGCLVCHANRVESVEGTLNKYETPVFRGFGISCERCHGPGELHVARHESGDRVPLPDFTIVNPARLEPKLAAAICQQCHLKGEERVLAEGRGPFDFRPGMPLELFWTVFVRPPELRPSYRTVSQVEQMQVSRCFLGSQGQLGCTSCHDPHRQPSVEERPAFYRTRCMKCHEESGCSLPIAERRVRQPDDSCVACHMSKEGSSNILHVAVTDHRVLRYPDLGRTAAVRPLAAGEPPLRPFIAVPSDRLQRDLGIALARVATADPKRLETLAGMALERLVPVTSQKPDDLAAWEARAEAHRRLGQWKEAIEALEYVVAKRAVSEAALTDLAELYEQRGELVRAAELWQRAVMMNPDAPAYQISLARVFVRLGRWTDALRVCQGVIQAEPVNTEARVLSVTCWLRLGERWRAKEELERLLALRPSNGNELRQRFSEILRE